jgi:hypothetical protein
MRYWRVDWEFGEVSSIFLKLEKIDQSFIMKSLGSLDEVGEFNKSKTLLNLSIGAIEVN